MATVPDPLPADLAEAHAMILAECAARRAAEVEAATAKETKRLLDLEIERLKLEIARLRRQRFGTSSERSTRLEQLELALAELEETVAETDAAAALRETERSPPGAVGRTPTPRKPARRPLPEHLPRTRVVYPAPTACPCCGGAVRKLGEEITESLERLPARWLVVQHVREKVSCRACESIGEAPAPFHPIARGRAGPNLLAEVMFGKYGLHLPLNRQSACFAREGVDLDVSTLADWVGAVAASLQPLTETIEAHVRAAARIHADETPVPVLAKGKTKDGRLWTIVRDAFGGPDPPAAVFFYSPNRSGVHAERFLADYTGIMQADAFSGFGRLYKASREPGPVTEAGCWAHARRGFFELAELQKGPIAIQAVKRIDALFAIEREINGASAEQRLAVRNERSRPLIDDLEAWLRAHHARLSAKSKTAQAIDYLLKRWPAFTRFLDDGRICLSNNAAERALRGIALGRRNWTFAGSDEGGRRAAAMYTLIETAKLNGIDPRAWLADVLARLPGQPARRIDELLPWQWQKPEPISVAA